MRISDWSSDVCSSDLVLRPHDTLHQQLADLVVDADFLAALDHQVAVRQHLGDQAGDIHRDLLLAVDRSEEHKSELQSLMRISYAVFCLNKKNILQAFYTHISL